jgi:hypothetical protein
MLVSMFAMNSDLIMFSSDEDLLKNKQSFLLNIEEQLMMIKESEVAFIACEVAGVFFNFIEKISKKEIVFFKDFIKIFNILYTKENIMMVTQKKFPKFSIYNLSKFFLFSFEVQFFREFFNKIQKSSIMQSLKIMILFYIQKIINLKI